MNKRKGLLAATVLICCAIAGGGTIAYYTYEDVAHNVITSGGVTIELVEKSQQSDGTLIDFPKEGITGVMPGERVSKIVSVKNTGSSDAWIRVVVDTRINDVSNTSLPTEIQVGNNNQSVIQFTIDNENWTYRDGYCYYNKPVKAGESTSVLFDSVVFNKHTPNEYQNCTSYIDVCAQAVQVDNNGEDVLQAQGWPEENKQ
ncbi:hypothetical protein [Floccifex sp.]|uniref:hypothetical protein n=1 Tax=Floccifex sp. TaxID=2815810 RepID=UPI002A75976D|nr:hypothetical protein [Floccifex sp.]MDY2957625.1 hypothetical protein [Floccifex sp.]